MRLQTGATLIELVVSVVIIATVATSAMMVVVRTAGSSADPLIRVQALAIAEAYMEEILTQALIDPAGSDTGAAEPGESRSVFDDVTDYHNLADLAGAVDQSGALIAGLDAYNVVVSVGDSTLNGAAAKRILVTVTHDGDPNFSLPLVAYRIN